MNCAHQITPAPVPAPPILLNRTYQSALALNRWIHEFHPEIKSLDLLTLDTHARRSWFVFRSVLGTQRQVGIRSVPSQIYDVQRWWHYSEGLKSIVNELVSYAHIRIYFLFRPPETWE